MRFSRLLSQTLLASLACFPCLAFAAPACPLADLKEFASDAPQCYFFQGSTAYRNKDYTLAAKHWQSLIALKAVPPDEKHWQVDADNNLGFLYYRGWGVAKSDKAAVNYWNYAFDSGHEEGAYHLCHYYADRDSDGFNRARGAQYCREAWRRYGVLKPEHGSPAIERQIEDYLKETEAR
jgi:TPR repeat protein